MAYRRMIKNNQRKIWVWMFLLTFSVRILGFSQDKNQNLMEKPKETRTLILPWEKKDPKNAQLSSSALAAITQTFQTLHSSSFQMRVLSDQEMASIKLAKNEKASLLEQALQLLETKGEKVQEVLEVFLQVGDDPGNAKKKSYDLFFRFQNLTSGTKSEFSFPVPPQYMGRDKNGSFVLKTTFEVGEFLATSMTEERKVNGNGKDSLAATSDATTSGEKKTEPPLGTATPPLGTTTVIKNDFGESENPFIARKKHQGPIREPWLSAFDVRVGYGYFARRFTVEDREFLPYAGAHGFVLMGEINPFAFSSSKFSKHLQGLGVRGSFLMPFWSDIKTVQTPGGSVTHTDQAQERRGEAAIHYRSHFFEKAFHPELELEVLYSYHSFGLQSQNPMEPTTLPSVAYHSLGGDIGGRIFFSRFVEFGAGFSLAKVLQLGPDIESIRNYGPGTGLMWRARGDLGVNISGFTFGARAFYEQKLLSFSGIGQKSISHINPNPVHSASDNSVGIMATVGYQFSPL